MAKPRWSPGGGDVSTPSITGYADSGVQGDNITNADPLVLTGTADPMVAVSIYQGDLLLGTTTADANGNWSFTLPSLADGTYTFTASVGKGSHAVASAPLVLEIDRTASLPAITSATDASTGVLLSGTAEPGSEVIVYRDGQPVGATVADGSGQWELTDTSFTGQKVTYTAASIDVAGNESGTSPGFIYPNDAPVFSSPAAVSVAENQTAVLDVQATDDSDSEGGGLFYAITGGADATLFSIDADTGVLAFLASPDFEVPADNDADNVYDVRITVTDSGGLTTAQDIAVTVTDAGEAVSFDTPSDTDMAPDRIAETAAAGTAVGIAASAHDPDAGSSVSYSVDDARFAIDANGVITRSALGTLDAASEPSVELTVTATSSDGTSATQGFTVSVVPDQSEALFRFAVFGDYGDGGAGEAAVAALVDGWNVDFILTAGDNAYGSIAFDDAVGQFYSNYIGNYTGSYGSGSDINRFFPTLGDGDYEDDSAGLNGGIDIYLDYFTLPDNERYYDFQIGSVHFFALNSDSNEPDGEGPSSLQAQWFDAAAAASDAMFEIAYFHHTAYRSDGSGDADLRWNFEAGGVDAVFAGHSHDYDLVTRDDDGDGTALPYITTGMGGFGETSLSSVGANLVTITDAGMLIEFYLADGTFVDSYFVEAPAGGDPLFVNGNDVMNGSAADDYLWGLAGADILTGFAGNDMLIGGEGNDRFVFDVGSDADVLADFTPGAAVSDVLDLRAFGIDSAAGFQQTAVNQGGDVFLDFGGGDTLLLLNVQEEQFHDNDFVAGAVPNDPPTITSAATATVAEGQIFAIDVDATDDRAGLVYSISGGADRSLFGIDSSTGVVSFLSAPDFEAPGDGDADNAYQVQVTVTDSGGLTDVQDVTVNVADVGENTFVFERRIAASLDDVEERSTGSIMTASSDLEFAFDGTRQQTVGMRFTGIEVPQGAIITKAYIQFEVDEVSTGAASLTIRGEDTGDAAAFADIDFNVSSRTTTGAFVNWSPEDWTTRQEAGPAQQTPDLSTIVQEIVNRGDWAALNDLVLTVTGTGTRTAESADGRAGAAPLLHIEYSLPGSSSDPVAFDDPADSDSATNRIAELAAAGTAIGITASATDPDAADTVGYSLDDARFAIGADGVITRSGSGVLDFESTPSISLTVTATSSDRSVASHVFSVDLSDSPEPVAFEDPADIDGSVNRIAEDAAAGTEAGITASADDPDAGSIVSYSVDDARFAVSSSGVITRSNAGALDAGSQPTVSLTVTATSSDGSQATHGFDVSVVSETLPQTLRLAKVTDTGQWSPSSPDASGIAYISHLDALLVSDGEVNEMPIFTGDNLFLATLGGSLSDTLTTIGFSDEPTGVAYNPDNQHVFFSDDTGTRSVYEMNPGGDRLYGTADDVVTSFATAAFGSRDPEGLAYDAGRDVLYITDGVTATIYTVNPGLNGMFDGVSASGGDDVVTSFDAGALGIEDPEGLEYDARYDILYITSGDDIAMLSTAGELLGLLDIASADVRSPAGLALAPSSADPGLMSLYLADRGVDNNSDPNENDGKIYEFVIDDPLTV